MGKYKQYAAVSLHNRSRYDESIPGKSKKLSIILRVEVDFIFMLYIFNFIYLIFIYF